MKYEKRGYINENYRFFHLKDQEGPEFDYHFHEFDKLVILLEGKVTYALEHEEFVMEPGNILLVPHHTIHKARIDYTQPYERIIIYFDGMYLRSLVPSTDIMYSFQMALQTGRYLLKPDGTQKEEIEGLLLAYERSRKDAEEERRLYGAEAYEDSLMIQLLVLMGRMHTVSAKQTMLVMDGKIQEVLNYINENLAGDLSVETLAEHVHLSRSYLMCLFKKETGTSVHASITQKRLLYAARRIREGMPVLEVVSESGFADYTTFYRSFRQAFGINPSELKN